MESFSEDSQECRKKNGLCNLPDAIRQQIQRPLKKLSIHQRKHIELSYEGAKRLPQK